MNKLIVMVVLLTLAGCAGSKVQESPKVKDLEFVELKSSQNTMGGETVGVNKDDVAVLQKRTQASDEFNRLVWQNNDLEWKLHRQLYDLKSCRNDLADPRLGGNGEVTPIPQVDGMKKDTDVKEEFGLVGGNLQFITTEDFLKRIDAERSYQKSLEKMLSIATDSREDCERRMGIARRTAGLPSERIQGISTVTPDGKIDKVIRKNENNLDDAFDIVNEEKAKQHQ